MTEEEAIDLLSGNGNLIKRPFVVGEKVAEVGFKPDVWESLAF
jgi:arsenate reductase